MANPELLTKDDVPLYQIAETAIEMADVFNEDASQGFVDRFTREVNQRTFMARTGDVTWDEVAELEHARIARGLDEYHMAFTVASYAKSLGVTRDFVEDSTADYLNEHIAEILAGGSDQIFDLTFDTLKNGVADGSTLWYTPESYAGQSFTNTHDHTYTGVNNNATDGSRVLFSDTASHSPTEIAQELAIELTEHGYSPDTILTTERLADQFVLERTDGFGSNFYAPRAEELEGSEFPRDGLRVRGMDTFSTAWLRAGEFETDEHPIYVFDSSQDPVYRHTVRPMELTDNTGAPIGGVGNSQGDPGASLLGAYGTMRLGTKFHDPLAGAVCEGVPLSEVTTS